MSIFVIYSTDLLADGSRRYYYFETSHSTMEDLAQDLRSGPVAGRQLRALLRDGQFVVTKARAFLLTTVAVHHACEPDYPFVFEGVV